MTFSDSSTPVPNGQDSPSNSVKAPVVLDPTKVELIEMRGTYGYWVHMDGASIGEVRTAIKDGWWHFCEFGNIIIEGKCVDGWQLQAKELIAADFNEMRPQPVQLAQANAQANEMHLSVCCLLAQP